MVDAPRHPTNLAVKSSQLVALANLFLWNLTQWSFLEAQNMKRCISAEMRGEVRTNIWSSERKRVFLISTAPKTGTPFEVAEVTDRPTDRDPTHIKLTTVQQFQKSCCASSWRQLYCLLNGIGPAYWYVLKLTRYIHLSLIHI